MKVGLFIPCYIEQCYPQVGLAMIDVLQSLGVEPVIPEKQTCCGQPMFNTGCVTETEKLAIKFYGDFKDYDYIVAPSGSCVHMVRHGYNQFFRSNPDFIRMQAATYEFCEFIHDVLNVRSIAGTFPHKVGFHKSCHGLRGLRLDPASERNLIEPSKAQSLVEQLIGIEIVTLERSDECCGFGGTFSVFEKELSIFMGQDRLRDHQQAGAEIITGYDTSCLMHMEGILKSNNLDLKTMHVAEILSEAIS